MAVRLVKQFARDFSLCISGWWRDVSRENFLREFGVGFSDTVAVGDGLSVACFFLQSDFEATRKAFFATLGKDPQYYLQSRERYLKDCEETRRILSEGESASPDEKFISLMRVRFSLLYPMLRICNFVPSEWAPEIRGLLGKEAEATISSAFEDRIKTEGVFESIDSLLRRLCEARLREAGKPERWSKFVSAEELEALAAGKAIDWNEVEKRSRGFVYSNGKIFATTDYHGVFADNGYEYREEPVPEKSVKGTVAFNGGIVRGTVRLLFAVEQLKDFREGEVLVSPMTVPDFVPAMKKAAAIVTDEGGITCHAAIVARELGKPCVIGTKFATKMFKDGDIAEVDSQNGVVRKLK